MRRDFEDGTRRMKALPARSTSPRISLRAMQGVLASLVDFVGSQRAIAQTRHDGALHPYADSQGEREDAAVLRDVRDLVWSRENAAVLHRKENGTTITPFDLRLVQLRRSLAAAFRQEASSGKRIEGQAKALLFGQAGLLPPGTTIQFMPEAWEKQRQQEPFRTMDRFDAQRADGDPDGGKGRGPDHAAMLLIQKVLGVSVSHQNHIHAAAKKIAEDAGVGIDEVDLVRLNDAKGFRPRLTRKALLWLVAKALGYRTAAEAAEDLSSDEARSWDGEKLPMLPWYDQPSDPKQFD